jgi:hypothetical protein
VVDFVDVSFATWEGLNTTGMSQLKVSLKNFVGYDKLLFNGRCLMCPALIVILLVPGNIGGVDGVSRKGKPNRNYRK